MENMNDEQRKLVNQLRLAQICALETLNICEHYCENFKKTCKDLSHDKLMDIYQQVNEIKSRAKLITLII